MPCPFQSDLNMKSAIVSDAITLSKPGDETMVAMLLANAGHAGGAPDAALVCELQPALIGALAASVHNNSLALYWTLMRLAQNPATADGIAQEFHSRPKGAEQHLNQAPFALAAVREALRLSPVLPFIERKASEDLELCGMAIPKGTMVVFSPWIIHRDENVWSDAQRFDPNRFIDADRLDMTKWFPFGLGHRACIGSNLALNQIVRTISLVCSQMTLAMPEVERAVHWRPTLRVLLEPQENGGRLLASARAETRDSMIFNKPEKRHEALFC